MRDKGLIETEPDGNLLLTDAGVHPDLDLQDAISFSWKMSEDSFEAFRSMETGLIPGRNPCR